MPLRSERRRSLEEEIKLNFRSKRKTIQESNSKEKMEKYLFFLISEKQQNIFCFLPILFLLRLLKMIQPLLPENKNVFLTIIERNPKPFPRQEKGKQQVLFQKTIRGRQYLYQGHYKDKLASVSQHSPIDYEILKKNGRVRNS